MLVDCQRIRLISGNDIDIADNGCTDNDSVAAQLINVSYQNTDGAGRSDVFMTSLRSSPTLSADSSTSPPSLKLDLCNEMGGYEPASVTGERRGNLTAQEEEDLDMVLDAELGHLPADFLSISKKLFVIGRVQSFPKSKNQSVPYGNEFFSENSE